MTCAIGRSTKFLKWWVEPVYTLVLGAVLAMRGVKNGGVVLSWRNGMVVKIRRAISGWCDRSDWRVQQADVSKSAELHSVAERWGISVGWETKGKTSILNSSLIFPKKFKNFPYIYYRGEYYILKGNAKKQNLEDFNSQKNLEIFRNFSFFSIQSHIIYYERKSLWDIYVWYLLI